jgi:type IX secretion system substrate protein/galactose oxidase-like protein
VKPAAFTTCFSLLFASLALYSGSAKAQSGTWTWVNGTDSFYSAGVYGTQGVPSANNSPPGLYQAAQWTDLQGNFWIYGGLRPSEREQGDLWKYDPAANTWTWIKGTGLDGASAEYGALGIPAISNTPGARAWGCTAWTDTAGDLWLFGGADFGASYSDLWRYQIASNEWTWMAGPQVGNLPGIYGTLYQPSDTDQPPTRSEANTAWVDSGNNLWLYGGYGELGDLGDMWRYSPATGQWAWMGGTQAANAHAVYGTQGVESPGNFPGGRWTYTHWMSGNYLYLSGGLSFSTGDFSDVWQFNLNTNYWSWVGGDSGVVDTGVYLHYCSVNEGDMPVGRAEQRAAQVNGCSENLYVWGGGSNMGRLNDLWAFDLPTKKWRWVSGSSSPLPAGNFGIRGLSSPSNMPQGMVGPCLWSDKEGNLWLWGGLLSLSTWQMANAMWKYVPDPTCFPGESLTGGINYTLSQSLICPGDTVYLTVTGATNVTVTPAINLIAVDSADYYAYIASNDSTTYTIHGQTACGPAIQNFTIIPLYRGFHISASETNICSYDSTLICAPAGLSAYQWNNGDTTACIYAKDTGNYYVVVTPTGGNCTVTSQPVYVSVYPPMEVEITRHGDSLLAGPANSYQWLLNGNLIPGATSSVYVIGSSIGSFSLQVVDSNGCIVTAGPVIVNGINEVMPDNKIAVYPNPTADGWQLAVDAALIGSTVEVYDATGRLVFRMVITGQTSYINIPGAASGVYELRVTSQGFSGVRKVIHF